MKHLYLLLFPIVFMASCASEEPDLNPQIPDFKPKTIAAPPVKKKEPPRYEYAGTNYRDPFIPLNEKRLVANSSQEAISPNIDSLVLKGILDDGKDKMAILNSGGMSYILKGSSLYDSRRRLIKDVSGDVKKDSVTVVDSNKRTRNIKIREE